MTSEDLKSGSRAFFETCLSIVGGATFVLQMISHIAVLSGNDAYDENEAIQITVFSAFLLLSLTDGYVHFRIYNHKNYDKSERSTIASSTTEISHQSPTIASFDNSRDTDQKLSTHYTALPGVETSEPYVKKHQHQHQHQHQNQHQHQHQTCTLTVKSNEFSWLAFICTASCSIDIACLPSVIMSCLRGRTIIGPVDDKQRWIEIGLSTAATAVSAWNSSRLYVMSKKHLMGEEEGPCPCKH